jgi:hypothetical protein
MRQPRCRPVAKQGRSQDDQGIFLLQVWIDAGNPIS